MGPRDFSMNAGPFKRLGAFIIKRKRYVVVVWILALVLVVPIILGSPNVTSLQQGGTTGSTLESTKASTIIAAQFQKGVPNSTLLVVVTASNVSSPQTSAVIDRLVSEIQANKTLKGLTGVTSVYSALTPVINSTNRGAYDTYDNANDTGRLIFGVPTLYLRVWQDAFTNGSSVAIANSVAYQQTAKTLTSLNPVLFQLATSHVLDLFNMTWANSWHDPAMDTLNLTQRADIAAATAGELYVRTYLHGSAFGLALVHSVYLHEIQFATPAQLRAGLTTFVLRYMTNTTGFSAEFVNSTFLLGRHPNAQAFNALADNIVWNPGAYDLGPQISSAITSFVSPSRDTTLVSVGFDQSSNQNVLGIRSAVKLITTDPSSSGVQSIRVTGTDALNFDSGNSTQSDLGVILPVTIVLLIVATGLFFRSALTPFVTLGTIGVALLIAQIFIVLVGTYIAKVDFTIPTILLTIIIGVGTDYSVFVIARYREERVKGWSVDGAVETSLTWAGESIATSGATVIISFLALSLTTITYLRTMGIVVGLGVLVALSVALTLVPAILAIIGGWTFWPNSGRRFEKYSASVLARLERKTGYFSRSGSFAVKRAKVLVLLAFVVTAPTLYVYANTTPTYDFLGGLPTNLESISASNHLTASFGAGRVFPSYLVVTFASPLVAENRLNDTEMEALNRMTSYLNVQPDIDNVSAPTMPFGRSVPFTGLNASVASDLRTLRTILQSVGKDNRTALVTLNFKTDPFSTQSINDAQTIRQYLHKNFDAVGGVSGIYVGGASGSILDTKNVFNSQFNSVLPIVAIGVALVLLFVLGSIFLPLFAVVSVLMSIVWSLAVTKLVFQAYFNYGLLFITPLFLFVVLLGLGMDYNIFILTRIREEAYKGESLNAAIVRAIEQTGGIITAAAIILAGSLGALMLSNDLLLKQLGFAFSFSILIDALVVRTYLVPAVMSSVKRWNWYNPIKYLNRSRSLFDRGD